MAGSVGRPPKPAALRVLNGNAGHRPLPDEPLPRPGVPDIPPWAGWRDCGICKLEWERLVTELQLQRVIALKYGMSLTLFFDRFHVYHECRDILASKGFTVEVEGKRDDGSMYVKYVAQRPEVSIGNKALYDVIRIGGEFGWTPSSNTRLKAPPADDDTGEQADEFFARKERA